jgi:predicted phosphoribosyltransferase
LGVLKAGYQKKNRRSFQLKFKDRFAAGEILASLVGGYKSARDSVTIIGIARGGIIVGDVIAEKLDADFDFTLQES